MKNVMNIFNDPKRKYLAMIPVVFIMFNAVYFQYATKEIKAALLQEKFVEIESLVNMLAAAVEADATMGWREHERHIVDSVEFMDKIKQVYGGAYRLVDGELVLITNRDFETSMFDPLNYPELSQTMLRQDSGAFVIGYTPEGQAYRDLHVFFRWMPLYVPRDERYLVIAGVSEYSIVAKIPLFVSIGQWCNLAITFILNIWLIVLLARLGYIYEQRNIKENFNGDADNDRC